MYLFISIFYLYLVSVDLRMRSQKISHNERSLPEFPSVLVDSQSFGNLILNEEWPFGYRKDCDVQGTRAFKGMFCFVVVPLHDCHLRQYALNFWLGGPRKLCSQGT